MDAVPDEDLMAYADDALPPDERARIEALVAADPVLRARLQPLVLARAGLSEIFGPLARKPVPEKLVTLILSSGPSDSRPSAPPPTRKAWGEILSSLGEMLLPANIKLVPIAAFSVVALTAVVTIWLLRQPSENSLSEDPRFIAMDDGGRYAVGKLVVALNTAPSGKALAAGAQAEGPEAITPVLSFRSGDGRYCRQYRIEAPTIGRVAGLACRGEQASAEHETWRIVIHSQISPHAPTPGEFRPASGSGSPAVDAAINGLIEGDVLDPSEEAELIGKAWTGAPKH